MKAKINLTGQLMILTFSIMVVSCGKGNLTGNADQPDSSNGKISGGIMDLGVVTGNIRLMNISLSDVAVSLSDEPNKSAMESSRLSIYLHTESDGIIKDGTYYFSKSDEVSSFTFRTILVYMQNQDTDHHDAFDVSSGAIVVGRTGTYYTFTLNGTLSNGKTIHATFGGTLSYSD